jgi:hypothetical protein
MKKTTLPITLHLQVQHASRKHSWDRAPTTRSRPTCTINHITTVNTNYRRPMLALRKRTKALVLPDPKQSCPFSRRCHPSPAVPSCPWIPHQPAPTTQPYEPNQAAQQCQADLIPSEAVPDTLEPTVPPHPCRHAWMSHTPPPPAHESS